MKDNPMVEVGNKYGRWTVLQRVAYKRRDKWQCVCSCGTVREVYGFSLRNGKSKSCGCYSRSLKRPSGRINEKGKRYGKLVVIEYSRTEKKRAKWICKCDCGTVKEIDISNLRKGTIKSCGCYMKSIRSTLRSLPKGEAAFNSLYESYKRNAEMRKLLFCISKEEFKHITTLACHYCGKMPYQVKHGRSKNTGVYIYNGIDRVDNSIGYTSKNVVPCCGTCNYMKGKRSYDEFREHIENIHWCLTQRAPDVGQAEATSSNNLGVAPRG